MLTHGIIYEWSKYLKKITKATYFRQAIHGIKIELLKYHPK
jgi:hypothetical protein